MPRILLAAALLAVAPAFAASALIPAWDASAMTKACEASLEKARKTVAGWRRKRKRAPSSTSGTACRSTSRTSFGPISLLGSVHPDKAVRDAAEPCLTKYTTFSTELLPEREALRAREGGVEQDALTRQKLQQGPPGGLRGQRCGAAAGQARARQGDLRQARGAAPGLRPQRARRPDQGHDSCPRRWTACPESYLKGKKKDDGATTSSASTRRRTCRS